MSEIFSHPHRRYNPLLDEWVLVSPQRNNRPWQGQEESITPALVPPYDPHCYLCPGNARAQGRSNPAYTATYVFENDFPALTPGVTGTEGEFFRAEAEAGLCRVICYSPRHDVTLPHLPLATVTAVVATWAAQYRELAARGELSSVMIFENRGAMMGASNPHPHGQIWANAHVPNVMARELAALAGYRSRHGGCLLCDCLQREQEAGERIICENDGFVALVPFWACWPFEVLLLSKAHVGGLEELDGAAQAQLADILIRLGLRYDNLFQAPFPTSWGIHLPPCDSAAHPECHLHAHFFPPLLRSASIRKFLVGYELLAMPQRDLTPEDAAARLRAASTGACPRRES
ncbi:MAG: UDP-glucose--hexose-1-phosphate uridylyltransferase [Acidobacteria bacterium]|nr:MAG: UDP-glucose--hexose-1-phosphate uridylyltransferase [Acidobacteriota bacterium]